MPEICEDLLVCRVDHQPPAQEADSLGLEAECKMARSEVAVERGVEELLLRRVATELERRVEAPFAEPDRKAVDERKRGLEGSRRFAQRKCSLASTCARRSRASRPWRKCSSAEKVASIDRPPVSISRDVDQITWQAPCRNAGIGKSSVKSACLDGAGRYGGIWMGDVSWITSPVS